MKNTCVLTSEKKLSITHMTIEILDQKKTNLMTIDHREGEFL
jgi:hypothetical protein